MGNSIIEISTKNIAEDNQSITMAIESVLAFKDPINNRYQFQNGIRIINKQFFKNEVIAFREQSKLCINSVLMKIWYSEKSEQMIKKMFEYWLVAQNKICRTNILFFKISDLSFIWEMTKFFIIVTDKRNSMILNNIHSYKLTEQTQIVKNIIQSSQIDTKRINIIDSLTLQQCLKAIQLLSESFSTLIKMHDKLITRSKFTLNYISQYSQNTFVLFCRIYLHTVHFKQIHKAAMDSNPQKIIEICAYFLGRSIQEHNSQLYQLSILVLLSFINEKNINKKIKGFPSHLFKHIPVIKNRIFQFIFISILFVLESEKNQIKQKNDPKKIKCNRFHSFRVLAFLIQNQYVQFQHLSYFYIENICITTNVAQIERIYLTKLIKSALKLKYSNILLNFIKSQDVQFILNFPNRKISVKGTKIQEYLQNIFDQLPIQIIYYAERYVYGSIYKKIVIPLWNQDYLWKTIIQKHRKQLREKQ